jgi:hypothetical protein
MIRKDESELIAGPGPEVNLEWKCGSEADLDFA